MKDFCLRRMRKEYQGMLRTCTGTAVVLLLCFALLGAVSIALHVPTEQLLLLLGIGLVVLMMCFGAYLILSDPKWLLKKTPFGRALCALGEPGALMAEIDQAAEAFFEHHGSFILLRGWLVLLLPDGWAMEPYRLGGCPIRRGSVREILLLPDSDPNDPQERHVRFVWTEGTEQFYVYQQQDLDALRGWMEEGGLTLHE